MPRFWMLVVFAAVLSRPLLAQEESGPLDWSLAPFSDSASHVVLLKKEGGLGHWQLRSAWALGGATAQPKPAKDLFEFEIQAEGAGNTLAFQSSLQSLAHGALENGVASAQGVSLAAECGSFMPEEDVVLLVASFHNAGSKPVDFTPLFVAHQNLESADYLGKVLSKASEFILAADRSKAYGRKAVENTVILTGLADLNASFQGPGAKAEPLLANTERVVSERFELKLGGKALNLGPGRSLRFPVLLCSSPDAGLAQKKALAAWKKWALPVGAALKDAQRRWAMSKSHLAKAEDPAWQPLVERAALTLLMADYAPRAEMRVPLFSGAKGFRDDFFSLESAWACLGWAELDMGRAQEALLELLTPSNQAARPVPPYMGEGFMDWEAGGLPAQNYVAWDLYHRDHDHARARQFFARWSEHVLNESQWWPSSSQAVGKGLYRYSDGSEPDYLGWIHGQAKALSTEAEAFDVGLSSLVAWQMQAASAVASGEGRSAQAVSLQAQADSTEASLLAKAWDGERASYNNTLDGYLPFLLSLDRDAGRARNALGSLAQASRAALPFVENGVLVPWRAACMLRLLSLYGYSEQSQDAAKRLLAFLGRQPALYGLYDAAGQGLQSPGDAATAAAVLQIALQRYDQEALLLPDTKALGGRIRELRTPDGSFSLELLPPFYQAKAVQPMASIASRQGGAILQEGEFILSLENPGTLSVNSRRAIDIGELRGHTSYSFKGTHTAAMILKPRVRYLFRFEK